MKIYKAFLSVLCIAAAAVSFLYLTLRNRDSLGEYYAKSAVNVEIDRRYAKNIALSIKTEPSGCSYWLAPTTDGDDNSPNIVMHVRVPLKRPYWEPALQLPLEQAGEAVSHIDNIAMFIGNKLHYFTHDDIPQFKSAIKDIGGVKYALYYLPGVHYASSLVFPDWSNYYGDVNLGIKALTAFFVYPAQYAFTWIFLALFALLNIDWIRSRFAVLFNAQTGVSLLLPPPPHLLCHRGVYYSNTEKQMACTRPAFLHRQGPRGGAAPYRNHACRIYPSSQRICPSFSMD